MTWWRCTILLESAVFLTSQSVISKTKMKNDFNDCDYWKDIWKYFRILQLRETGAVIRWINNYLYVCSSNFYFSSSLHMIYEIILLQQTSIDQCLLENQSKKKSNLKPLSFKDLSSAFAVLCLGICFSFLTFLIEHGRHLFLRCRNHGRSLSSNRTIQIRKFQINRI